MVIRINGLHTTVTPAANTSKPVSMDNPELSVIVPTYLEASNLRQLVVRVCDALQLAGIDAEIVIVDDDSPDDTVEICHELIRNHYPVVLDVRVGVRGLSSAVLRGIEVARGNVFVVMDGDLSHPPEKIPELWEGLTDANVDFVIGSRYVSGGTTEAGWGAFRWLNSKVASLLAYPLTGINDPMAGFFAISRAVVRRAEGLDPIGYKIGLELIVKCRCTRIVEIPISFQNRHNGTSKLTFREQLNYLKHLNRLYQFKFGLPARLVAFVFVGATGLVIDLASLAAMLQVWPFRVSRAVAISIAMTWNFFWNREITFENARTAGAVRQYASFCHACVIGAIVNWSVSVLVLRTFDLSRASQLAAAACGAVAGALMNFLVCHFVVFKTVRYGEGLPVQSMLEGREATVPDPRNAKIRNN